MASLNAGATVTLTLGADDSVSVQVPSGASCIVEKPVGTRIAVVGSGSQAFGPYSAGTQVKLSAEGQAILYDSLDGRASPYLSESQSAALQSLVSGDRTPVASSRDITVDDNGKLLTPTNALTLTIPAGLSPMPSFTVDCPASGTVSIARGTTATINGAGITLTRTRANNPVGFVVLAHESDAYGVSGA